MDLIIIVYISAALIAVMFTILVIALVRTLSSVKITLDNVAHTIEQVEKQLKDVTEETTELLQKTNIIADDISKKSQALQSVVDSVKGIGANINQFNQSLQKATAKISQSVEKDGEKVAQIVQWGNALVDIWGRWKAKKEMLHDHEHEHEEKTRRRSHV